MIKKLCDSWRASGVEPGDILLLHSSVKRTIQKFAQDYNEKVSPEDILDSFLMAVGERGTLLLPLFNFGFASGQVFDIRNTPSQMGKMTEVARMRPGVVRTGHPIYSFAVFGRLAKEFENVDNFSGYGADSPFGIITNLNGKIGALNVPDNQCMTYYHHVEEMCSVDYRYHKNFLAQYIDRDGISRERTYGLFVRDLDRGVVTDVTGMEDELWRQNLCMGDRFDEGFGLKVVKAKDMFHATSDVIRRNKALGLLYKIEKS